MASAVAGDTVYFRGGIYEPGEGDQFSVPPMHPAYNGSPGNPIVFKGYPGETAVIRDATWNAVAPNNNTSPAAGCSQNSYVTWDGFTFVRDKDNGYQASAIVRFELSNNCALINSELIGRPHMDYSNGSLIHIVQSSSITIANNRLHGMSRDPNAIEATVNTAAIWVFNHGHIYIHNNDFYDNYSSVNTKVGANYLYIYKNHIWDCGRTAFTNWWQVAGMTDEIIYQNVIRNCPVVMDATSAGNRLLYNLKLYNNTVYNSGSGQLIAMGHITYQGWRGSEVFNNIIRNDGGGNPLLVRYFNASPEDMPSYADYNLYHGGGYWNLNYNSSFNYSSLAAWRTATGLDSNSTTADPLFVNPGGASPSDYKLQSGSPARVGRGGSYASAMGAYITGDEVIGYSSPLAGYYVAPDGDDANPGTISNPWASPLKAWTTARAGDTVYFRSGTYTINSQIWTKYFGNNGTSALPISFRNYPGETVTFASSVATVFRIEKNHNHISGINFTGAASTWFQVSYDLPVSGFRLSDCSATMGSGGDNVGLVYFGAQAADSGVQRCRIVGPGLQSQGSHGNTAGIVIFRATNITVANNEISNAPIGIYYKHANPDVPASIQIAYNYIHDTDRYAIFLNANYANVHDNVIAQNNGPFQLTEANGVTGGNHNTIEHNTILSAFGIGCDDALGLANSVRNNLFRNNVELHRYCAVAHETAVDFNLYPLGSPFFENRVNYSFTAWRSYYQGAPSHGADDSHSIEGAPVFVGGSTPASLAGFALAAGSPGRNTASDIRDLGAAVELVGTSPIADDAAPQAPRGMRLR